MESRSEKSEEVSPMGEQLSSRLAPDEKGEVNLEEC